MHIQCTSFSTMVILIIIIIIIIIISCVQVATAVGVILLHSNLLCLDYESYWHVPYNTSVIGG